jgi:[protein-PII] uridylyltransferase
LQSVIEQVWKRASVVGTATGTGTPETSARQTDEMAARLDRQLAAFPLHYLAATSSEQILADLDDIRSLQTQAVVVRGAYAADTGTVEYRVITRDQVGSGLFSRTTGVLAAKGLEILSAGICTTSEGFVVDSFRVRDRDYSGPIPESRLEEIKSAITAVLIGTLTVEQLFARHKRLAPRAETQLLFREPTRVVIDSDSSERFTIIEVFAHDRRGLLYVIASALLELRLSVSLAKIATHLDQVLDVFYVTDREGGKLHDDQRLEMIRDILTQRVEDFHRRGLDAPR